MSQDTEIIYTLGSDQHTINLWICFGCLDVQLSVHPFFLLSSNSFQKLPPHRTSCPTEGNKVKYNLKTHTNLNGKKKKKKGTYVHENIFRIVVCVSIPQTP